MNGIISVSYRGKEGKKLKKNLRKNVVEFLKDAPIHLANFAHVLVLIDKNPEGDKSEITAIFVIASSRSGDDFCKLLLEIELKLHEMNGERFPDENELQLRSYTYSCNTVTR